MVEYSSDNVKRGRKNTKIWIIGKQEIFTRITWRFLVQNKEFRNYKDFPEEYTVYIIHPFLNVLHEVECCSGRHASGVWLKDAGSTGPADVLSVREFLVIPSRRMSLFIEENVWSLHKRVAWPVDNWRRIKWVVHGNVLSVEGGVLVMMVDKLWSAIAGYRGRVTDTDTGNLVRRNHSYTLTQVWPRPEDDMWAEVLHTPGTLLGRLAQRWEGCRWYQSGEW